MYVVWDFEPIYPSIYLSIYLGEHDDVFEPVYLSINLGEHDDVLEPVHLRGPLPAVDPGPGLHA